MFDRIPDICAQRALLKPDAIAFRELARGTSLTYAELENHVRSLAGLLHAQSVGEGDRVLELDLPALGDLHGASAGLGTSAGARLRVR